MGKQCKANNNQKNWQADGVELELRKTPEQQKQEMGEKHKRCRSVNSTYTNF